MHSPGRFKLPLMVQDGSGAPSDDAAPSRVVWAVKGTSWAPSTAVRLFRPRQSHGAMNAPA